MEDNAMQKEVLMHYGIKRRSGRYPWGSGDDPYQHGGNFLGRIQLLKAGGWSETPENISSEFGMSTGEYRLAKRLAAQQNKLDQIARAKNLKEKGWSNNAIAEELGLPNESSVRSLLNPCVEDNIRKSRVTADFLREQVDKYGMIDVGKNVNIGLGITANKMEEAVGLLQMEGYELITGRMSQVTNPNSQQKTTLLVLAKPGTPKSAAYNDLEGIHQVDLDYKIREADSYEQEDHVVPKLSYPASMDSSRIKVVYADEKGIGGFEGVERDGLVQIRRGVKDLNLGDSNYAQVRILVDGTHYVKGMAVYSDDIPDGYDLVFNTNKRSGTELKGPSSDKSVFKPIDKTDPNNPFGTALKRDGGQSWYEDSNGELKLNLVNKPREQGDWGEWENTLAAQFLSKQSSKLIKQQLKLSVDDRTERLEEIMNYTNPTVKKKMLQSFADDCDSTAVHLEAAALPRQRWHVILPVPSMGDNEIYAPQYQDGEKVALIRYPHAGLFEIPILTVNNKNKEARKMIGNDSYDAVGINSSAAGILSGADFDGDTVMLIPTGDKNGRVNIKNRKPFAELANFDDKMEYGYREGMKVMSKGSVQREMGEITNLITDMTLKGAPDSDLIKAVKHSMVIIDAYKHKLDYKRSETENEIDSLKDKYQRYTDPVTGKKKGGAGTIVSRAKSQDSELQTQGAARIDPVTGEKVYKLSGRNKVKKMPDGTYIETDEPRMQKTTKMAKVKDAYELVSEMRHPTELLYADYANSMKRLANQARLEILATPTLKYDKKAAEIYAPEADKLKAELRISKMNAPLEREAQRRANIKVEAIKADNPGITKKEVGKISARVLEEERAAVGAKRHNINITEKQWEAIQAGAITDTTLKEILNYTKPEVIEKYAMPKKTNTISTAQIGLINSMRSSNYTIAEIANRLGVSESTVTNYIKDKKKGEN